jgi:NADH-quinone oxidoreductase subunit C
MSGKAVATSEYPGVSALIRKHLPAIPFTATMNATEVDLQVEPQHLLALVQGLMEKKDLAFEYLRNITGIDMQEEGLLCKYNLYSISRRHSIQVTVSVPNENPRIPSLSGLFQSANWHEREAAEMVGLEFAGHPNLKNLLLEEDLRIHPLLKAHPLQKVEILQGIEDTRPGFDF